LRGSRFQSIEKWQHPLNNSVARQFLEERTDFSKPLKNIKGLKTMDLSGAFQGAVFQDLPWAVFPRPGSTAIWRVVAS
jgi:hypothetical protein